MLSYISELKKKKKPNGAKYEMKGVLLVDEIMPNCERIIIDWCIGWIGYLIGRVDRMVVLASITVDHI